MEEKNPPMMNTTPTGRTAFSGGAGSALGFLFVVFFPMVTGVPLTTEQAAGIMGAIGSIASFVWHQVEVRRQCRGGDHGQT